MIKNILCPSRSLAQFSSGIRPRDCPREMAGRPAALAGGHRDGVSPGVSRAPKDDAVLNEARAALERDLRRMLTARRASDVKVEIFMRKGNVVREILAQAKASRADLW